MKRIVDKICGWIIRRGYIESGMAGDIDAALREAKFIFTQTNQISGFKRRLKEIEEKFENEKG